MLQSAIIIFFPEGTYYWSRDLVYLKFVRYNLKVSHHHYVCYNCWLI